MGYKTRENLDIRLDEGKQVRLPRHSSRLVWLLVGELSRLLSVLLLLVLLRLLGLGLGRIIVCTRDRSHRSGRICHRVVESGPSHVGSLRKMVLLCWLRVSSKLGRVEVRVHKSLRCSYALRWVELQHTLKKIDGEA